MDTVSCNLPEEATIQDVAKIYWQAWEMGLKGITIYRYGSKSKQWSHIRFMPERPD